jgi:ElaB/YqjD/DUF883 family membrane-anchored ribosome-binding protein
MAQSYIGDPPAMRSGAHAADCAQDRARESQETLGAVGRQAADTAWHVSERGRDARPRMQDVTSNFKAALDKSLEHQPMATLAVAAIVGFLLGALWRS